MNIMKAEEIKRKKVKEYLYVIMPYLADLINNKKSTGNEWKIQINMGVKSISSKDTGETLTFSCIVIMKKLDQVMKQLKLLISFLNLF